MIDLLDIPVRMVSRKLDEPRVTLRELVGAQSLLVTFLRHAECSYCEMHVSRLRQHRNEIGRIVLVSFDADAELRLHELYDDIPREWALLVDDTRELYTAAGVRRASSSARTTIDPRVWPGIVLGALRGARTPRKGADIRQLGADLVVDGNGEVRWSHISRGPEDRPSIAAIATAMRDADARGLRAA